MARTLMILLPEKEPDTKHICFEGGCPFFTKGQWNGSICKTLWENAPEHMKDNIACMCNFYDTVKPIIVEADGVTVDDIINRVQNK